MSRNQRNKGPKKPKTAAPAKAKNPVFAYTSVCCSVPATKPPVIAVGYRSEEAKTQTLGKFRCTKCGKRCKCNRSKFKSEEKNGIPNEPSPVVN